MLNPPFSLKTRFSSPPIAALFRNFQGGWIGKLHTTWLRIPSLRINARTWSSERRQRGDKLDKLKALWRQFHRTVVFHATGDKRNQDAEDEHWIALAVGSVSKVLSRIETGWNEGNKTEINIKYTYIYIYLHINVRVCMLTVSSLPWASANSFSSLHSEILYF